MLRRAKHPFHGWLWLAYILFFQVTANGQNTFTTFVDSALMNNQEAASIQTQLKQYELESKMIKAVLQSPRIYVSSDILLAPYINNNGKPVDTSPSDHAIGYDAGITNGGLYSALINVDVPVLKGPETNHRQREINLAKEKLKIQLKTIEAGLTKSVGVLYFDALSQQAKVANNRRNAALLKKQLHLIMQLTRKGLFRITDYKLMKLELQSDSVALNNSINDLELSLSQLKAACGIQNNQPDTLIAPSLGMTTPVSENSLFVQSFMQDSLSARNQMNIFNDQYRPQINLFANSGLNSTSVPSIQHHLGASAGIHLSYTLFDGHRKRLNKQHQQLAMEKASSQKALKIKKIKIQVDAFLKAIGKTKNELAQQKKIRDQYHDLLDVYEKELEQGQVSVIDFIAFLKKYSNINLAVKQKEITLKRLINEYNYWNH